MRFPLSVVMTIIFLTTACNDPEGQVASGSPAPTSAEICNLITQNVAPQEMLVQQTVSRSHIIHTPGGAHAFTFRTSNGNQYLRVWNPADGQWSTLTYNGAPAIFGSEIYPAFHNGRWMGFARDSTNNGEAVFATSYNNGVFSALAAVHDSLDQRIPSGRGIAMSSDTNRTGFIARNTDTDEVFLRDRFGTPSTYTIRRLQTVSNNVISAEEVYPQALHYLSGGVPFVVAYTSSNGMNSFLRAYVPPASDMNNWISVQLDNAANNYRASAGSSFVVPTSNHAGMSFVDQDDNPLRIRFVVYEFASMLASSTGGSILASAMGIATANIWTSIASNGYNIGIAALNHDNGELWVVRTVSGPVIGAPTTTQLGAGTTHVYAVDIFYDSCGTLRVFSYANGAQGATPVIYTYQP